MFAKINEAGVIQVYPYYMQTLRLENPNTSFPNNIEVDFASLAEFGVVRVFPTAVPQVNTMTHRVYEGQPVKEEQIWKQSWVIVELSDQEKKAALDTFKAQVVTEVQERLDAFARTRNYDGILSAATYATSTVPKFAIEGQYAVEARDSTWSAVYILLSEVEAGTRPTPTSYSDIEAALPELTWPA